MILVDDTRVYPTNQLPPALVRRNGTEWCRMVSSHGSKHEIVDFATRLEFLKGYYQAGTNPRIGGYYLLTPAMRKKAIGHGAREVTAREMGEVLLKLTGLGAA